MVKFGFGLFLLCKIQGWPFSILLTPQLTKREIYNTSATMLRISKPENNQMVAIQVCNGGSLIPRKVKIKKKKNSRIRY